MGVSLTTVFTSYCNRKFHETTPTFLTKIRWVFSTGLNRKVNWMRTNLSNSSFCIYFWLRELLAKGFNTGKSGRIASSSRHFEILQCNTSPQSEVFNSNHVTSNVATNRSQISIIVNTNENINWFVYNFGDQLPFFHRVDHGDLYERFWLGVRLNVKKISPCIAGFPERDLQRSWI